MVVGHNFLTNCTNIFNHTKRANFHPLNFMYTQVMMGGEWFEELFGNPAKVKEETIKSTALEALKEHLGITQEPSHTIVSIHKVQFVMCCDINVAKII